MNSDFDIVEILGREVFDSEGLPAIEAEVVLENGARGRASCALTADKAGYSRLEPASWINVRLGEAVLFEDASSQRRIDRILMNHAGDAERLGEYRENETYTGCISAVSMAVSRASAAGHMMPLYRYLGGIAPGSLPVPLVTVWSSGNKSSHNVCPAGGGGPSPEEEETIYRRKEILAAPLFARDFSDGFRRCVKVYHTLNRLLSVCDEKRSHIPSEEAMDYVSDAMKLCGCRPGKDMAVIADGEPESESAAAGLSGAAVISIEQAVTVTEAMDLVEKAGKEGKRVVISRGSRETEDTYMADFAAAMRADFLKMGEPRHMECMAKYNELLRLEEWIRRRGR